MISIMPAFRCYQQTLPANATRKRGASLRGPQAARVWRCWGRPCAETVRRSECPGPTGFQIQDRVRLNHVVHARVLFGKRTESVVNRSFKQFVEGLGRYPLVFDLFLAEGHFAAIGERLPGPPFRLQRADHAVEGLFWLSQ